MVIRLYKHGQAWNLNILQSKSSEEKKYKLFGNKSVLYVVIQKRYGENVPFILKLIQVPWSVKTMSCSRFLVCLTCIPATFQFLARLKKKC